MDKKIGKNLSKHNPGMLSMHQKLLDYTKKSAIDTLITAC